jgi:hypothetical protein
MQQLPAALAPLGAYKQFIIYRLVPHPKVPGKYEKVPIDFRTGAIPLRGGGGAHDPEIWTDFNTAANVAAGLGQFHGVGFVFTEADPFFFLDVDSCLLDSGDWSDTAKYFLSILPGAAVEVSTSRRGLHVFGTGTVPPHSCRRSDLGLEFYTSGRFVALTGLLAQGNALTDCSAALAWIVQEYFPYKPGGDETDLRDGPVPEWNGPTDDTELLRRALQSRSARSAFGSHASFADLWEANAAVLARSYPDADQGRPYNASDADRALAQHLAFWTGNDGVRIERLMRQSALLRDKWDDRADYLPLTILTACNAQREFLHDAPPEPTSLPAAVSTAPRPAAIEGSTFLGAEGQVTLFAGCVYIRDLHRVLVPGGALLRAEQFRAVFGGYVFTMDKSNQKTTRNAWECFTESQILRAPRADGVSFQPSRPPAEITTENGRSRANVWWPATVPRAAGDVTPFLTHLRKVIPDPRDQTILLSYMAACVQYVGVKFQWAPVLQGMEGNGKTLFSRCVAKAVGKQYTHWPKASKLTAQFNGWLVHKVFIGVEDIFVPEHKREVLEDLKPMITGEDLEIEKKGVDQASSDVCCNFMLNCNDVNGVRKTRNDRRYSVFYTAQQWAGDLERDGMAGDYFPKLYRWLRDENGYAFVTDFLFTYKIPDEFNPATHCQRAPITSSTEAAITMGLGSVEQEVLEAIEQEQMGFAGGFVSSIFLDRLLESRGSARRIPLAQRRRMMQSLGYDWHPHLIDGRVNNSVLPDAGKPRLFVKHGSPVAQITSPTDVAKAYSAAQKIN